MASSVKSPSKGATPRFLKKPEVLKRIPFGSSTLYDKVAEGLFPKPCKLGKRASAWPEYEVDSVCRAMLAGQSEDEMRALVSALHAQRTAGDQFERRRCHCP